jgi:hypothetical protein
MTKELVYKDGDIELAIGDVVVFKAPLDDVAFLGTGIGRVFSLGVYDELHLEATKNSWLEVYFKITFFKDGVEVTMDDYIEIVSLAEIGGKDTKGLIYTDKGDYQFLRYLIYKGAR